ncbi:TIGR00266 family protein [uncultured Maricaulis sp.]|uniref:TIGR00266 family protein n=1 Tax=uncultured Maricaulis sp. TaxID=174710 RepID=UPI0030DD2C30|tara:strand:- start:39011 stop:39802 length:792 start_codon:yes stop_codon:yes gene_type:complete
MRDAHEIDYKICGEDIQFVEIELDPGETVIAEAGAMMYKSTGIAMESVFGDGSRKNQGFMGALAGAGKRLLTGESLFMTAFTHQGQGKAQAAFAAPFPGTIIAVHLPDVDGELICQKDSFLVAAKGVSIGIALQKKIMTGLFGGEGFIMQRLEGDGWCFIHAGGTLVERELAAGEEIHIDTGCVVAYTKTVEFEIERAGNVKSMIFGGEGVFFAKLKGPGQVWMQSMPFSRLAGRIMANMPVTGSGQGEGSVLGPLGSIIRGN